MLKNNTGFIMISRNYFHLVFVAIMAMSMTLVLSFVSTVNNEGFSSEFVPLWLHASGLSFAISFPTALLVAPIAKWLTEKLVA